MHTYIYIYHAHIDTHKHHSYIHIYTTCTYTQAYTQRHTYTPKCSTTGAYLPVQSLYYFKILRQGLTKLSMLMFNLLGFSDNLREVGSLTHEEALSEPPSQQAYLT